MSAGGHPTRGKESPRVKEEGKKKKYWVSELIRKELINKRKSRRTEGEGLAAHTFL